MADMANNGRKHGLLDRRICYLTNSVNVEITSAVETVPDTATKGITMATRTRKAPTPAAVTVAAAVEVVAAPTPATLDTLTADIRDLANVVRSLVGALTPMLTTGTVKSVTASKIATTATKAAKARAPKAAAPKHRAPTVGETIAVGDLVSLPVGALKGKCGDGLAGIVTGVVLSLGTQVAKNRGDMPAGLGGTVLTIKLSASRNVWAWTGDARVALTGKRIVEETVVA